MSPTTRARDGVFDTPVELAARLAHLALDPLVAGRNARALRTLSIMDLAVGEGVLILAALDLLERRWLDLGGRAAGLPEFRERFALTGLHGIDIDGARVDCARQAIAARCGVLPFAIQVRQGDALDDEVDEDDDAIGKFDAILINPPWVSARTAAAAGVDRVKLRGRFATAQGAFDLASVFVERGLELLAPGGRLAAILPHALLTARHARPWRELVTRSATVTDLIEIPGDGLFAGLSVRPMLIAIEKRAAADDELVRTAEAGASVAHADLAHAADGGFDAALLGRAGGAALERRSQRGVALCEVAAIYCMTAGFDAAAVASKLVEGAAGDTGATGAPIASGYDFVTSGAIARFHITDAPRRYQRRLWQRPRLITSDPDSCARAERPKIVIAGMTRRLRAALAPGALAGAVGVFAVSARAGVDPLLLLGCLNANSTSDDYALRYPGKRMKGGYLGVNRHTLERLPIVAPDHPLAGAIAQCAGGLHEARGDDPQLQARLDLLVERALS